MNHESLSASATTDATPLCTAFFAHIPETLGRTPAKTPELEALLARLHTEARAAWPAFEVEATAFAAYIGARQSQGDPLAVLAELFAADLYLACACAAGNALAIDTLLGWFGPVAQQALARVTLSAAERDDVLQQLRDRLLVGGASRPAVIAQYAGRGPLKGWLRVAITREALQLLRRRPKEAPGGAPGGAPEVLDALLDHAAAHDNPEIAQIKRLHRQDFAVAFRAALAALRPRERNLLRYGYLEGMSTEQVGAMYGVHKATAARWIALAREQLYDLTKRELSARLRLDRQGFESMIALINTHLDVSLSLLLDAPPDHEDGE